MKCYGKNGANKSLKQDKCNAKKRAAVIKQQNRNLQAKSEIEHDRY